MKHCSIYSNECEESRSEALRRRIYSRLIVAFSLFAAALMIIIGCARPLGADGVKSGDPPQDPSSSETSFRRFSEGTVVNGVDIAGLTEAEAAERLMPAVETGFTDYECTLRCGDRQFVLGADDINLSSDLDAVLAAALSKGSGEYSVTVAPVDDRRLTAAIEAIAMELDSPPKDAELLSSSDANGDRLNAAESNDRFILTEPEDGVSVDRRAAAELVLSGSRSAELPIKTLSASRELPHIPSRLARFSTSYNSPALASENRIHNIKKGSALINGAQLAPGESFSCNEALGERSGEAGWAKATAFAGGGRETEQQYGGGICQISTTLYNCALLCDLQIVARAGHSRKVSYIDGGRDAALSWEGSDLVIKNSTGAALYIYMWTDDRENALYCEIYGKDERADKGYDDIELISELIETIEPSDPEFVTDDSLDAGECVAVRSAITGSRYKTYRIYKKNGAEVRRELIDETTYAMHPAQYAVPPAENDGAE